MSYVILKVPQEDIVRMPSGAYIISRNGYGPGPYEVLAELPDEATNIIIETTFLE